jgi:hypothetical protein
MPSPTPPLRAERLAAPKPDRAPLGGRAAYPRAEGLT